MTAQTVITTAGIAAAVAAGLGGPQIQITKARFGSSLITPLDSMVDVTSFVQEIGAANIRYSIRDENTVVYRLILDETMGDYNVGNVALVLDDDTVFSISSLPAATSKVVGNRREFTIPLTLSGIATISDLTVILADVMSIPEVATQALLPAANVAPFNTYLVRQNTLFANRATIATSVNGTWRYYPEDLGAGALVETNGIVMSGMFDAGVASGEACWFNTTTDKFENSNITTNPPRGIRGSGDTFHSAGSIYTHGSAIYVAGTVYYAQADGSVSDAVTDYEIGFAISTTKLFVTAGLVQGEPWGGGGGYSPAGRVRSMFLTGPAYWPRQRTGYGPAQNFIQPTDDNAGSLYYYTFPKTGLRQTIELMIPKLKSINLAQPVTLQIWWGRPASASPSNAVKWGARHIRIAEGVNFTASAVAAVTVVDNAPSATVHYFTSNIALDFNGYTSADEIAQILISRHNDDVADTLASDAYLFAAILKYTEATDTDA